MAADQSGSYVGPYDEQDKYRLLRQVGHGGEAELWKAELDLVGGNEPVAIKILHPDHHRDIATWRQRWTEQVDLLRLIHHPGVVGMHTLFEGPRMHPREQADPETKCLYLVMNWVDGLTLRDWVAQYPGPEHRVEGLEYLVQVAGVLDYLHSGAATPSGRPVIHGDISPSNVIINDDGQAVLVDFGLFRMTHHVTKMGAGTFGYCAPEVARGGEYSPASDRYAFGGLAYYTLTGTHPPTDPRELRAGLATVAGVGDRSPNVDELAAIFAEDPAQRPAAGQWLQLLRLHSTTATARNRPLAPLAAGATPPSAPPAGPPDAPGADAGPRQGQARTRRQPWTVLATSAMLIASMLFVMGAAALLFPRDAATRSNAPAGGKQQTPAQGPTTAGGGPESRPEQGAPSSEPPDSTSPAPATTPEGRKADLGELTEVGRSDYSDWGELTAGGKRYTKALVNDNYSCHFWIEYQLSKKFLWFHSMVGINDYSKTGSRATFTVEVDGVVKGTKSIPLFETDTIDVSLADAQRMKLSLETDNCPDAGFIDPYVIAK